MSVQPRGHIATLRGVGRMAVDATAGVTDLVEALHTRVARVPVRLAGPLIGGAIEGITDLVYDSVRGVTRLVGGSLDTLLAQLQPLLAAVPPGPAPSRRTREALRAALNGVLGDYLAQTGNPLAIAMALRRDGVPLNLTRDALQAEIAAPRRRIVLLVHGLCMNDLQWQRDWLQPMRDAAAAAAPADVADTRVADAVHATHDHGAALARDLGATALYLHYNTGLHISSNGRALAAQIESMLAAWPQPDVQLFIVGHSMGALVARSALHYGAQAGHAWPQRVRGLCGLGAPHHGAPLERSGHWIDLLLDSTPYTAPFARLGRVRSAGIQDLRHGSVLDEDWQTRGSDHHHPLPLPAGVACYALAATATGAPPQTPAVQTLAASMSSGVARAAGLAGDGLVPVDSALGRHRDPRLALAFPLDRQAIAWNCGHLELLSSPAVCAQIRAWFAPAAAGA
jgi:hypothetical protein